MCYTELDEGSGLSVTHVFILPLRQNLELRENGQLEPRQPQENALVAVGRAALLRQQGSNESLAKALPSQREFWGREFGALW